MSTRKKKKSPKKSWLLADREYNNENLFNLSSKKRHV